jgi:hypothetical protein
MAEWTAFEALALRFYQAIEEGNPPPGIRDGIQRHYAYVMGSTVAQRNKAVAENWGREYERVHERAISSFHSCVNTWQTYRDALGLPIETSRDDVEAAYGAHRERGGWVTPAAPLKPQARLFPLSAADSLQRGARQEHRLVFRPLSAGVTYRPS